MEFNFHTKNNFIFKIMVIIISMISPLIMVIYDPEIPSLSSYWKTPLQPLFLISNLLTSLMFITIPKWKLSGVLLLILTCFSVEYYGTIHNIFATTFFIVNTYALYSIKKYRLMIPLYLVCLMWSPNLLWIEIHAIFILCLYHLLVLIDYNKILKKRNP
jgi:hypothetical protein|tara:strand:+ start:322 stop:798 length:477 start_codon:yes stop_codon:yes gene_type:complete